MYRQDLFDRLPASIFSPLASRRSAMHWQVLLRVRECLKTSSRDGEGFGAAKGSLVRVIESVLDTRPDLWLPEGSDTVDNPATPLGVRANSTYQRLLEAGWLEEERVGYHDYVAMPFAAGQLLTALVGIAEHRPVVLSGHLKSMRSALEAITQSPLEHGDRLPVLAEQARSFSDHLGNVLGVMRTIYGQARKEVRSNAIVRLHFDAFARKFLVDNYRPIKTSENPRAYRTRLLELFYGELKHRSKALEDLREAYVRIYSTDEASALLDKDLDSIETAITGYEDQLEAIDRVKLRYEMRIKLVAEYVTRRRRPVMRLLEDIVRAASRQEAVEALPLALTANEAVGEGRMPKPKRPRTPPSPRVIEVRAFDEAAEAAALSRRWLERQALVSEEDLVALVEHGLEGRRVAELSRFPVRDLAGLYRLLELRHAIRREAIDPGHLAREWPILARRYHFMSTEIRVSNPYLDMPEAIVQRVEGSAPHAD